MTIQLEHIMVPSRDKVAAAKLLGELLNEPDGHLWEMFTVSYARQTDRAARY